MTAAATGPAAADVRPPCPAELAALAGALARRGWTYTAIADETGLCSAAAAWEAVQRDAQTADSRRIRVLAAALVRCMHTRDHRGADMITTAAGPDLDAVTARVWKIEACAAGARAWRAARQRRLDAGSGPVITEIVHLLAGAHGVAIRGWLEPAPDEPAPSPGFTSDGHPQLRQVINMLACMIRDQRLYERRHPARKAA